MPTNRAVGSSNLSGRANYSRVHTGHMGYRLYRYEVLPLCQEAQLMLGVRPDGVSAEEVAANHFPFFDANEDAPIGGVRKMVGLAMEYVESR